MSGLSFTMEDLARSDRTCGACHRSFATLDEVFTHPCPEAASTLHLWAPRPGRLRRLVPPSLLAPPWITTTVVLTALVIGIPALAAAIIGIIAVWADWAIRRGRPPPKPKRRYKRPPKRKYRTR